MNETIKKHLDAISEELIGTPNSFLFLMSDKTDVHAVKNCPDHNAAGLMFIYIDSTEAIDTAFSNYVLNVATELSDESGKTFQERLGEKIEEKGITVLQELKSPE